MCCNRFLRSFNGRQNDDDVDVEEEDGDAGDAGGDVETNGTEEDGGGGDRAVVAVVVVDIDDDDELSECVGGDAARDEDVDDGVDDVEGLNC